LGLQNYTIFRQDRGSYNIDNAYGDNDNQDSGRRGGGIWVAFRCADGADGIKFERSLAEDYNDNIMNFDIEYKFNCRKCNAQSLSEKPEKKFGFTVVYRRPGPYKNQGILYYCCSIK
jgi:hypothetical protein